jgi:hypothetical protein
METENHTATRIRNTDIPFHNGKQLKHIDRIIYLRHYCFLTNSLFT